MVVWPIVDALSDRMAVSARIAYILVLMGIAFTSVYMTFVYTWDMNENTQIHGWPIPIAIFKRKGLGEHWDDYIGPTLFLALPLNFILFAFLPSLFTLVTTRFAKSAVPGPHEG